MTAPGTPSSAASVDISDSRKNEVRILRELRTRAAFDLTSAASFTDLVKKYASLRSTLRIRKK